MESEVSGGENKREKMNNVLATEIKTIVFIVNFQDVLLFQSIFHNVQDLVDWSVSEKTNNIMRIKY